MAAAHRPRVLFLHTTALSDAEYTAYFDALHDIMDEPDQAGGPVNTKSIDENLEAHVIGIREARAWMRGRFRDMGNLSNVDKVLGMLTPSAQNRCISAGQFFAALRLLMHARNGSDVSDAMLFIQADVASQETVQPPNSPNRYSGPVETQASSNAEAVSSAPSRLPSNLSIPPPAVTPLPSNIPSSSSSVSAARPPSSELNSADLFNIKHTFFSSVPALSSIETSVASSSATPFLPLRSNTSGSAPVLASLNPRVNEIKIKILDLRRRALAFASNGEMIERDPLLVKEIIRLLADLKREQELPIVVQKRTLPEDTGLASAGPSPKKQRGDGFGRPGHDYSNQTRSNAQNTYSRYTLRAQLREITQDPDLEMQYTNYETSIVHRYGVELVGWPLAKFSLDGVTGKYIDAVVDGLKSGSIRWVRLTEEQLIARIEAWKTRDKSLDAVKKKRIRIRNQKKVQKAAAIVEEPRSESVQTSVEEDSTPAGDDVEEVAG